MGRAEIKRFRRAAEEAAAFLKPRLDGNTKIKIIAHNDSDGMASAAILARCFYSYNVPFTVKFGRAPNMEDIAKLENEDYGLFVFLDQGSGQLDAINKYLLSKRKDVLIMDHHQGPFMEGPNLYYINPHHCGLSGTTDVSASGTTFSVVEQIDLRFRSLIDLAIVGAIGDRQDLSSGFAGVNDTLVKRAIDLGLIQESEGLKLVRRTLIPVVECLRTSTRPYVVGLSGNLTACRQMIDALGIPYSRLLSDLGPEIERRISDAIFARVGALATNEEFRHSLWGTIYKASTEDLVGPKELREYASMLDACGYLRKPEVGFAAAVGDENSQAEALSLLSSSQEQMLRAMGWLVTRLASFKQTSTFRYIYCGDAVSSEILGETLSLIIESGLVSTEQPLLGIADMEGELVRVSARGAQKLAAEGMNLGRALSKAASEVGGWGGGHDVSAAARIPRERVDEFIKKLDKIISGVG